MTTEHEAMWVEITGLKEELERLSVKREALIAHLERIRALGGDLEASKAKVKEMAAEVEQLLGARNGTD